ncbi:hypothetical protein [Alloactinosynnema sp. L-07]|uniref:DUF5691 domain-containing protein n=1 Tax=Alloactinosynnema sp. L-07 TaxID=1653480 RepID=UPI00065F06A6|nr:DUF5691 domain-containing protein [Alloactinosynnema sp. L-07]CRK57538.1 hypothetical protein [Alloactinosynnema sp. L-07]
MTGWDDLVAAALLGTRRRPVRTGELPKEVRALLDEPPSADAEPAPGAPAAGEHTGDSAVGAARGGVGERAVALAAADRLLTAAALMAGYRRAGRVGERDATALEQAVADVRGVVPAAARRRLDLMLTGDHTDLLGDWLDLVHARGFRLPPERLPALAEVARVRPGIRHSLARVAAGRGNWLGALNPEWSYLASHRSDVDDVWRFGDTAQRIHWLTEADPEVARAALAADWGAEPAPVRVRMLRAVGKSLDDEFLESALDDRAQEVRALAADLLAGRPESDLAGRMARRLAELVAVTGGTLVVRLPAARDDAMARDGVPAGVGRGGQRTAWLRAIVAAAPLGAWGEPGELLAMPVQGCDAGTLREAWALAAARQRNVRWARALLETDLSTPETAALVGVLPAGDWARAIKRLGGVRKSADLAELVIALSGPWPADLGDALLDWLAGHGDNRAVARAANVVARTVPAECLDHRVATQSLPSDAPAWRRHLWETLNFRRRMDEELR